MQFDNASPIWTQLVAEFSRRIAVGQWAAGDRIAGVRELAVDLGVNPNTVQRALAELDRQELCRSERTLGRFVTEEAERIRQLRFRLAGESADEFIEKAQGLGMGQADAQALIADKWPAASLERN